MLRSTRFVRSWFDPDIVSFSLYCLKLKERIMQPTEYGSQIKDIQNDS